MPCLHRVEIRALTRIGSKGFGCGDARRDVCCGQRAAEMRLAGNDRGDVDLARDGGNGQRARSDRTPIDIDSRAIGREGRGNMRPLPLGQRGGRDQAGALARDQRRAAIDQRKAARGPRQIAQRDQRDGAVGALCVDPCRKGCAALSCQQRAVGQIAVDADAPAQEGGIVGSQPFERVRRRPGGHGARGQCKRRNGNKIRQAPTDYARNHNALPCRPPFGPAIPFSLFCERLLPLQV
jgi:hypothetical protein